MFQLTLITEVTKIKTLGDATLMKRGLSSQKHIGSLRLIVSAVLAAATASGFVGSFVDIWRL